ncbi:DUF357 domain-containing protein [Methanospirillum sp.]|uniref:DUF357 domain-containing protein n=1 Tax=Methanospirillum sp. TaxID=45200 RepID=UPI0029853F08|nr:DUF357 domain-containing protein [Methanospirillum sp.]
MFISDYHIILNKFISGIYLQNSYGSPYHLLGTDILQMVRSYLQDSEFFLNKGDIVNQYASLVYAHGWLDAGAYLGLYSISSNPGYFEEIIFPNKYDKEHLFYKTSKYYTMLGNAISSITLFPGHGSPLAQAADTCLLKAEKSHVRAEEFCNKKNYVSALGHLCYGYGWLDTAVRAGLLTVHANFDLFTTEF